MDTRLSEYVNLIVIAVDAGVFAGRPDRLARQIKNLCELALAYERESQTQDAPVQEWQGVCVCCGLDIWSISHSCTK